MNGIWRLAGWSLEAGVFGGTEPEGPYDFSNIRSFPDSWSGRMTRRWTSGAGSATEWEASVSHARVTESHHGHDETTRLLNAALRRSGPAGPGRLYGLAEASRSDPEDSEGYTSLLAEMRYDANRHQRYLRLEYATRPEYARMGPARSDDFFRYDHDGRATGATRWLIATAAYARQMSSPPGQPAPLPGGSVPQGSCRERQSATGRVPRDGLVVLGAVPGSKALPGRQPHENGELRGAGCDDRHGTDDAQLMATMREP